MERLWKPACRCPACSYPNNNDRTFAKPPVKTYVTWANANADMALINKCFTEFQESYRNKPYERQKDSSEVQLSSFLHSLVPPKKVSAATAEDIVKFWLARMPWENKNSMYTQQPEASGGQNC